MTSFEQRVQAAKRALRAQSMDGIQRRSVLGTVEVRAANDDGGYVIEGHGAVFNSRSEDLGGFREEIDPAAFDKVLAASPDVRGLSNHDPQLLLGATRNGSMQVWRDGNTGIAYRINVSPPIAATYYGSAMRAQLSEGLATQSSFAFRVGAGGDEWSEDPTTGELIRRILPNGITELYDMSPVTYPAYPAADSGIARSLPDGAEIRSRAGAAPSAVMVARWSSSIESLREVDSGDADALDSLLGYLAKLAEADGVTEGLGGHPVTPEENEPAEAETDSKDLPTDEQHSAEAASTERALKGSEGERQASDADTLPLAVVVERMQRRMSMNARAVALAERG